MPHCPSWEVRRNASLGVSYNSHYANIQNATRTCIIPALCIFGIIGNIVNLIVLTRVRLYKLESTSDRGANIGLAILAVSDMLLCLTVFPSAFTNQNFAVFRHKSVMLYYQAYGTGVVTTFILTSTWITLTLAVMRYFIICHPFSSVSFYNQKTIRSIYCGVCTLAVIINFPTFFHFKISEIGYVDNSTLYFIDIGIMDGKTAFSQVFQWLRFTVFIVLPALILVYCNCSLVWALHASRKLRQQCVAVKEPIQRQNRVTLLLIIIAFGFIKSHHVMMTFLVFDLDVLFIPCYSSFFLSFLSFFLSFRRVNCVDCSSVSQKLSIESTSNFLCICRTIICSAL